MVAIVTVPAILDAALRVGVTLHPTDSEGNLYVWHTPAPERAVVYIGKSASKRRLAEETSWRDNLDPKTEIVSGIVTLLRVNEAQRQALHYEPSEFDGSRWRAIRDADRWFGSGLDHLDASLPLKGTLPASEIEKLLVRIAVRYGAPVGNSQFGSQWEGPVGSVSDTLAFLAVATDPSFVIPKTRHH